MLQSRFWGMCGCGVEPQKWCRRRVCILNVSPVLQACMYTCAAGFSSQYVGMFVAV